MLHRADKATIKQLDRDRRGRLELAESYDLSPWAALYSALHHFGYPNNKVPKGKESTFSYVFRTDFDGLFIELSDFRALVAVHLVYTDAVGQDAALTQRDALQQIANEMLGMLSKPVDHFGVVYDPLTSTFTD